MDENKTTQQVLVVVPQCTQQDFLNHIANSLGSYKWPPGAIECIDPDKTRLLYLWGNRFKGTAEGSWNAKVSGTHKITINDKEVKIPDGTPYSGTLPPVEFDVLVINDNEATPSWAKEFCKIGFMGDSYRTMSDISEFQDAIEGDNSGSPYSTWTKNGNKIVDNCVLSIAEEVSKNTAAAYVALNIVPIEVIQHSIDFFNNQNFSSRDVTASTRNSVTEDPTPVLIPFYVLEFQFEGQPYHIAIMAGKQGDIKGKIPPVRTGDKTPEQIVAEEMPDKTKQANIIKWGWVLAIILLLFTNYKIALVYLVIWLIGYLIFKKPIDNRVKEIERQNFDNTKKTAELLKKQLIR